jgi:hypothetical protein
MRVYARRQELPLNGERDPHLSLRESVKLLAEPSGPPDKLPKKDQPPEADSPEKCEMVAWAIKKWGWPSEKVATFCGVQLSTVESVRQTMFPRKAQHDPHGKVIPDWCLPLWERRDEVLGELTKIKRIKQISEKADESKDLLFFDVNNKNVKKYCENPHRSFRAGCCPSLGNIHHTRLRSSA